MKEMLEFITICTVSGLLIIFAAIYFAGTKKRRKLNNLKDPHNYGDLIEQIQIINAQLDLMFELSLVFVVCYDYGRDFFYISENGKIQLGYDKYDKYDEYDKIAGHDDPGAPFQKKFEDLIHEDYISLYEEVTDFADIRKHEIAESPYIIKLKNIETQEYSEYLMRVKPIFDEDGINKALVAAFINTEYIEQK